MGNCYLSNENKTLSILKCKNKDSAEAHSVQSVPFESHVSAVQLPPDAQAINTLVRLGLVTQLYGKFATNYQRSQEFNPH